MEKIEYQKMYHLENHHWWFVAKHAYLASLLKQAPWSRKNIIADIGCGTGGTTAFLHQYGKVIGVEPSPFALPFLRKRQITAIVGTATSVPIADQSVDIACFLDVLYHRNIKSNNQCLTQAYRILKPGGTLIVTDCAFAFLKSAHDKAVHARERYTKEKLTKKIEKLGFSINKATYTYWSIFPLIVGKRLLNKLIPAPTSDVKPVPRCINTLLIHICRLEAVLLRYLSFPWGSSILIIAVKPLES